MHNRFHETGTQLSHYDLPDNVREALDLGRALGQRRALAAVGGRCSAAHAQILRRIRDEKLYRPVAPSWRAFCARYLARSRRHTDRLIALLNRFGPVFFELSELTGITPKQFPAVQPAIQEDRLLVDGEAISLIPDNAPKLVAAVDQLLACSPHPPRAPKSAGNSLCAIAARARLAANQLIDLYEAATTARERELILEVATEIRVILLQPENPAPDRRRGA
jgi:hypothetical protein